MTRANQALTAIGLRGSLDWTTWVTDPRSVGVPRRSGEPSLRVLGVLEISSFQAVRIAPTSQKNLTVS